MHSCTNTRGRVFRRTAHMMAKARTDGPRNPVLDPMLLLQGCMMLKRNYDPFETEALALYMVTKVTSMNMLIA